MKRIVAFLLIAAMCVAFAACSGKKGPEESTVPEVTSPSDTTTAERPPETTDTEAPEQTTAPQPPEDTTTASQGGTEDPTPPLMDSESILVGNYVTVIFNSAACDVEFEVKRGVGSRQTVTLTANMKEGFRFDGWSVGNALVNNGTSGTRVSPASGSKTYTFDASTPQTVYLNASMTVLYHANGGTLKNGWSGSEYYAVTLYRNPNTLPEQGYFSRSGYTLVAYNTKEDGTGEEVSLGSKVAADGAGVLDLWCVWEKNTPDSDFTYTASGAQVTITGYKGSDETVVIPRELGGKTVVKIAEDAFRGSNVKKVVIAKSVKKVEEYAFDGCESLETVILFDGAFETTGGWQNSVPGISDESFSGCTNLKNIRINSIYTLTDAWQSCGAGKLDRLIWARDKKKLIIIGGSGSLYGFDCSVLDEALKGEYEIINFGENANITSLVYFDIAEDFVKEGDIILWCPEPGVATLGTSRCGGRFWDFKKSNYDFLKYIDVSLYSDLFTTFSTYCATLRSQDTRFKRYDALANVMNKYGDEQSVRYWDGKKYEYSFDYTFGAKESLESLITRITDKGASVYFSFAAMQKSGISEVNEKTILNYENMITSLPSVVSISDYKDCIYEDVYFWNSPWHMTADGAYVRAQNVAADIVAQLAKEGKN